VVLAERDVQRVVTLQLPPGATAAEAVARSRLLEGRADLDPATLGFAVFGRAVEPHHPLEAGDRVEVLRPLTIDPKDRRRARARGSADGRRRR